MPKKIDLLGMLPQKLLRVDSTTKRLAEVPKEFLLGKYVMLYFSAHWYVLSFVQNGLPNEPLTALSVMNDSFERKLLCPPGVFPVRPSPRSWRMSTMP
jgi:hypothetical protein